MAVSEPAWHKIEKGPGAPAVYTLHSYVAMSIIQNYIARKHHKGVTSVQHSNIIYEHEVIGPKTGLFGNLSQMADPSPPFGNPLIFGYF